MGLTSDAYFAILKEDREKGNDRQPNTRMPEEMQIAVEADGARTSLWRCTSCGEEVDESEVDSAAGHCRTADDGSGNPVPTHCGPCESVVDDARTDAQARDSEATTVYLAIPRNVGFLGAVRAVRAANESDARAELGSRMCGSYDLIPLGGPSGRLAGPEFSEGESGVGFAPDSARSAALPGAAPTVEREGQAIRDMRDYFEAWQGHTIPAWNDEFFRASEVREVVRERLAAVERERRAQVEQADHEKAVEAAYFEGWWTRAKGESDTPAGDWMASQARAELERATK